MGSINIKEVSKLFGETRAVDRADIQIKEGEFFTLLGPSGCGKTTLLRMLAGFYRQEEGDIYFDEKLVNDLPAHKRNIGMVFQNYAIFPHMTVFDNVAYGLKARKVGKKQLTERVEEALEMVELSHLKDRQPSQLSGGQQQRVALARAVVIHPGLLLMDEPLSNLDAKLRVKMRDDIRNLQKKLNITTIYVTHDQEEALAVSDRIAVLDSGKIQQIGKPHDIYLHPKNKFVANFIGTTNFLDGTVSGKTLRVGGAAYPIELNNNYEGDVLYSIRPEQINILGDNDHSERALSGVVTDASFLGESVVYRVGLENGDEVRVHEHSIRYHELREIKDYVRIDLNPKDAVVFNASGEEVLNEPETSDNSSVKSL
ncbi:MULTISPECIES: ABC transporter ATP-binding protein [Alteribacter]|uniref:Spermidine/putrescine import ATP-binding protein PotA n=1 Tax=Alteribacter keqinensis TaxID=2483800 RepID=A0A3M7TTP3_9BACI|nr:MULTISPECIES: ABC transporter ATP-binding protein [Alteribacter]MBM7095692.1 ABC transporter ATP-binding protein [Alteribacter salitolerans]RNA67723.1 ABC transporter ATP-binding protein [Alteribacter keqinensis]